MYQQIWTDYLSKLTDVPACRTLYAGHALRFIREESRMSRADVSSQAKVGLSLLKAIETKREAYTTWENTVNLARTLNISIETLIQRSREEFSDNFFKPAHYTGKRVRLGVKWDREGPGELPATRIAEAVQFL